MKHFRYNQPLAIIFIALISPAASADTWLESLNSCAMETNLGNVPHKNVAGLGPQSKDGVEVVSFSDDPSKLADDLVSLLKEGSPYTFRNPKVIPGVRTNPRTNTYDKGYWIIRNGMGYFIPLDPSQKKSVQYKLNVDGSSEDSDDDELLVYQSNKTTRTLGYTKFVLRYDIHEASSQATNVYPVLIDDIRVSYIQHLEQQFEKLKILTDPQASSRKKSGACKDSSSDNSVVSPLNSEEPYRPVSNKNMVCIDNITLTKEEFEALAASGKKTATYLAGCREALKSIEGTQALRDNIEVMIRQLQIPSNRSYKVRSRSKPQGTAI